MSAIFRPLCQVDRLAPTASMVRGRRSVRSTSTGRSSTFVMRFEDLP